MKIFKLCFIRSLISFIFILSFSKEILYSQQKEEKKENQKNTLLKNNEILIDKEDQELLEDLFKNDLLFIHDYVKQYAYGNVGELLREFRSTNDAQYRLVLLMGIENADFNNPKVIQLFTEALGASIYDLIPRSPYYEEKFQRQFSVWKVRALAAYVLFKKKDIVKALNADLKEMLVKALYQNISLDREVRSKSMMLLALSTIISEHQGDEQSYFLKKSSLELLIKYDLDKILNHFYLYNQQHFFYCWALVKSIGILKSKKFFFILLNSLDKFNLKVKLEAIRSVRSILAVNASGMQGAKSSK